MRWLSGFFGTLNYQNWKRGTLKMLVHGSSGIVDPIRSSTIRSSVLSQETQLSLLSFHLYGSWLRWSLFALRSKWGMKLMVSMCARSWWESPDQVGNSILWVCRNVMFTSLSPIFDGWNPTHQNCDEWGMVYGIAMPTLYQNGGLMGFFGDAMEYWRSYPVVVMIIL